MGASGHEARAPAAVHGLFVILLLVDLSVNRAQATGSWASDVEVWAAIFVVRPSSTLLRPSVNLPVIGTAVCGLCDRRVW